MNRKWNIIIGFTIMLVLSILFAFCYFTVANAIKHGGVKGVVNQLWHGENQYKGD